MIYITGDTHIPIDITKLSSKNFPEQKELTKKDYVIICGDFGGVWDNSNEELYWRKWLDQKPFTTLFVDGNHENFDLLDSYKTIEFLGGEVHRISEHIYHLTRGQIYTIDGKRIFTFGGASSHDRQYRTEHKTWWERELPSPQEICRARKNLDSCGWHVDYIITHCASTFIERLLSPHYSTDILNEFFDEIEEKATFDEWFFGHYHTDESLCGKFRCLYNDIIRLG